MVTKVGQISKGHEKGLFIFEENVFSTCEGKEKNHSDEDQ